ncbi:MAG: hypothetical protein AAF363_11245 [Bacteroidota bacterium]
MRRLVIFLLIFKFSSIALAQIEQPKRAEIILEAKDDYFTVVSAEENGMILFRQSSDRIEGKLRFWDLLKLNGDLEVEWQEKIRTNYDYNFIGYDYYDEDFYILFENSDFSKGKYLIATVDMESRSVNSFEIDKVFDADLNDFQIYNGYAVFIGTVNLKPALFLYNFKEGKIKVLPGIYSSENRIVNYRVDERTNTISVILAELTRRRTTTFSVKTYDSNGKLLRSVVMDPGPERSFLDGDVTSFDRDKIWVSGTYAKRKSKYSRGMFIAQLSNRGQDDITFINYGDFENFFKYMKERREKRVKSRIARRKEKGKQLRFNYRVLVHQIIERGDEYILVGEAYYPRYSQSSTAYGFGPSAFGPGNGTQAYFDGYRYTHAVVFGFDKNGNKLWDNCFEINDVITFDLEQYVQINPRDDKIVLVYNNEEKLLSKIIENDQVLDGKEEIEIATKFPNDEIKNTDEDYGDLKYWYGDHFYVYGIQKIKNQASPNVELNREVFFINKITYGNEEQNN